MRGNDETISTDTEACYQAVACQEEIYLEEEEEDLRAILVFDDWALEEVDERTIATALIAED